MSTSSGSLNNANSLPINERFAKVASSTFQNVTTPKNDAKYDFFNFFYFMARRSYLGPIIALFGERVVMQFMSQAMGITDCILLAVAPIGAITTVVSAIRVAGPAWLKAFIGRARETLLTAEVEVMTSTSDEVCELWNGHSVVRCPGSADVHQFICLLPNGYNPEISSQTHVKIRYQRLRDWHKFKKNDWKWSEIGKRWPIHMRSMF
ncbi:hypothetical protein Trihar35433_4148 [Trichoderma harzianum]|nr:hypothetical protein Trihar35433_4148 [Trichoderma harzianum]